MATSFEINWGILGCGGIAKRFTTDLLIPTHDRGVKDVIHRVVAVGSSTSKDKAQEFVHKVGLGEKVNCYGSYEELLTDPAVSVIYVATPHSLHKENVLASLRAGKHVLCEKPFSINRAEAQECFDLAREKNLFLMEAMWTRFFPATKKFQELISEGKIGKVLQVKAEFGENFHVDTTAHTHRMLDPALGGGSLLDLGVYPITWVYIALYALNSHESPKITSSMFLNTPTRVDRLTTALLTFSRASAVGFISCNMDADSNNNVEVRGTKGVIRVRAPLYRPSVLEIETEADKPQILDFDVVGGGMYLQADEVARCVRDGKLESSLMPWSETLEIMGTMDEIRKQGNFVYPMEK